ncbi:Putative HC-toxin efflux carrier TOXA [Bipolaris zeicola] [Rhizoctonia solani]|uniref:Putative HC-toxin efflux carrier TOXA [Bipolaris zeicola] n=1 Tax=Rhizoctonia solani TaxID=456999 RepID=A0A0K6FRQ4_9AGAM|nr:Putative HC-toxin efflux carrier TOXA [Bipolaris zeicola] [Rhizoctonia solani]
MSSLLDTAPPNDNVNDAIVLARSPEPDKDNDLIESKLEVPEVDPNLGYLRGAKLYIVSGCLLVTFLLVALDQTILATAVPRITSDFHALDEVTWIASVYFITQASFMLVFGQLTSVIAGKWVFLGSLFVFEVGSLFTNVYFMIAGRAVAGIGAAGITVGSLAVGGTLVRLEDRPVFMAGAGGCMALANIIGPILGGALADHVSWRWCFYINLPCGAVSAAGALIVLPTIKPPSDGDVRPAWHRIVRMDWVGALLCIGVVSSLLLGLQWGGTSKPWDDPTVIGLLVTFGVSTVLLVGWQHYLGNRAMIPLKALMRRTQVGCCIVAFLAYLQLLTLTYYLPLNFQSVKGHSATQSGIDLLPIVLSNVTITLVGSIIVKKTGYFLYWIFLGGIFRAVAGGLLFTLTKESGTAKLIGYQIFVGLGGGMTLTNLLVAVQADVEHEKYVPQATALVTFTQYIGGITGLGIGGSIFASKLRHNLAIYAPDTPAELLLQSVYAIRTFPENAQGPIIEAYTQSLKWTYLLGVPAGKSSIDPRLTIDSHAVVCSMPIPSRNLLDSKSKYQGTKALMNAASPAPVRVFRVSSR